jgi:hypothetical protein
MSRRGDTARLLTFLTNLHRRFIDPPELATPARLKP